MLYYLFKYLEQIYSLPGSRLFNYISFRAGGASVLSLFLSIMLGKYFIRYMIKNKLMDVTREKSIKQNHIIKSNTPSMGGIFIIISTLFSTFLFCRFDNIYILILVFSCLWLGLIGFIDDYIKIFRKDKEGLLGTIKLFGQGLLGIFVGTALFFHPDVVIKVFKNNDKKKFLNVDPNKLKNVKSTKTTIPFLKNNEFDYKFLSKLILKNPSDKITFYIYILIVIWIIAGVSNSVNLADGLDGLAASNAAIVIFTLGILAYLSGNIIFSKYLNILYIPNLGELSIFCVILASSCVGFLWYNTYPAQVFMGDVGSLMLGGVIAVLSFCIRKELMLPVLGGVFMTEAISVIIQVLYFKYTKKRYGYGKRIFLMAPLHHHFQQKGIHESKIVSRFLIIGILLSIFSLISLKMR